MGILFTITVVGFSSLSTMILLYLAVLRSGAQSVTVYRDIRYSNVSDKYKGVRQQGIIEY